MSRSLARDSEQMVESLIALAMACTASKSPLELAAKPASITSTLQPLQLARDAQLLVLGHGRAGRLLAVAQRGVEDDQLVCHVDSCFGGQAGALQARDDGLERCRNDVRIHADAEQRPVADPQLQIGHGAGVGAGRDGVLMVVQHADGFAGGLARPSTKASIGPLPAPRTAIVAPAMRTSASSAPGRPPVRRPTPAPGAPPRPRPGGTRLEQGPEVAPSAPCRGVHDSLDHAAELDLQAPRHSRPYSASSR